MSVNLSPVGGAAAQFFDNNGNPLSGGKLYTYAAGTTTPLAVYTTSAGNVAHTNPIILDSAGRVPGGQIWLTDGNIDYKFLLETSTNVLVGTFDNIPPAVSGNASNIAVVASTYNAGITVQAQLTNVGSATGAANVGFTPAVTGAVATTVQVKLRQVASVFDFMTPVQIAAVQNNTFLDVTATVQLALDWAEETRQSSLFFPPGTYRVTQITVSRRGIRMAAQYNFNHVGIVGIATVPTRSVVQLKCGSMNIYGLSVSSVAPYTAYECGIHWFSNDVNTFYPGFNRFSNMSVSNCFIGLCVGALPSQAVIPPYTPTAVLADGLAVNAPVSESQIVGFKANQCVIGIYFRQPNGKVSFIEPIINSTTNEGSSPSGNVTAFTLKDGEMTLIGGEILNVSSTGGALARIDSGTVNLIGVLMESVSPIRISGRSTVRMCNNANWGNNNVSQPFFTVDETSDGTLTVTDSFLRYGYGTAGNRGVIEVLNGAGTRVVNPKFQVSFTNVEFGDVNFATGATYQPVVRGCQSTIKNCRLTTHSDVDPFPVVLDLKFDELDNYLLGSVDLAAATVAAYAVQAGATSGGWIFGNATGAGSWGKVTTGLPTIQGQAVSAAIRLTALPGQEITATTPTFPVVASKSYLIKGWIKSIAGGQTLTVRANFFKFDGVASATALFDPFVGPSLQFGTEWQPLMLRFTAPSDATRMSIRMETQNGGDMQFLGLGIY